MNSGGEIAIPAITYSSFYDYRSQLKRDVLHMGYVRRMKQLLVDSYAIK